MNLQKISKNILIIFMILEPLLDLYFLYSDNIINIFKFSPATIIRMIFILVMVIFIIILNKKKLNKDFIEEIENKFKENENLYYIYSKRKVNKKLSDKKIVKDLEKKEILVEIYESSKKVLSDEEYIIYKLNKGVIN